MCRCCSGRLDSLPVSDGSAFSLLLPRQLSLHAYHELLSLWFIWLLVDVLGLLFCTCNVLKFETIFTVDL